MGVNLTNATNDLGQVEADHPHRDEHHNALATPMAHTFTGHLTPEVPVTMSPSIPTHSRMNATKDARPADRRPRRIRGIGMLRMIEYAQHIRHAQAVRVDFECFGIHVEHHQHRDHAKVAIFKWMLTKWMNATRAKQIDHAQPQLMLGPSPQRQK